MSTIVAQTPFVKTIGKWVAIGAVVPPGWVSLAYLWGAAGLPWEAPKHVIFGLMWIVGLSWPTFFYFMEILSEYRAGDVVPPEVTAITLLFYMSTNALYFAAIGSIVWLIVNKVWPLIRHQANDQKP